MDTFVRFTNVSINLRELANIGITVHAPVLAFLFVWFVWEHWQNIGGCRWFHSKTYSDILYHAWLSYKRIDKPIRGLIGMSFFLVGEFLRSSTIWIILHTDGVAGNYLSDIAIVLVALLMITMGLSCAVRNFTPAWPWWISQHRLWIYCLLFYSVVAFGNFFIW
jgi:hypothetical protein